MIDQFNDNKSSYAKMQQSQKIALMQDEEVYALLSITYLTQKQPFRYRPKAIDKKRGERFVVGIFLSDDNATVKDLNITLNHQPPIRVRKLEPNHKLLKDIPMLNSWSSYYMYKFKYRNQRVINFECSIKDVDKKNKKFYKVSRYLLEPK